MPIHHVPFEVLKAKRQIKGYTFQITIDSNIEIDPANPVRIVM